MKQKFCKPNGTIGSNVPAVANALGEMLNAIQPAIPLIKGQRNPYARALRTFLQSTRRALKHTNRFQAFIDANNIYWDADDPSGGYIYLPETFYAIIAQLDQWEASVTEALDAREQLREVAQ